MKMKTFCWVLLLPFLSLGQTVERYSVVIDEIYIDPSPSNGLPAFEFIELKNNSTQSISLKNWSITDGITVGFITTETIIEPDNFVIICPSTALTFYSIYGTAVAVNSFPSLNNSSDTITLKSFDGKIIHCVAYNSGWYQNEIKKQGGWTLEMKDSKLGCLAEKNWSESTDPSGGTPGRKNSIDQVWADPDPTQLLSSYATDSIHITLVFNGSIDSANAIDVDQYTISNEFKVVSAELLPPLFQVVKLELSKAIVAGQSYEITVRDVTDCIGTHTLNSTIKTGRAVSAAASSLVINEILFNPRPGVSDYVEIFNRSETVIDASKLFIANRNVSGSISSVSGITGTTRLMFPKEYLVITEDPSSLAFDYVIKDSSSVLKVSSLPSFPDEKGIVVLLNEQGDIIDELQYSEKWQFPLMNNPEGVSLERIDPNLPAQNAHNWHSASSDAGYGTPGYANSQLKDSASMEGELSYSPLTFSPDNDGFNDMLTINYHFPNGGYVCNITIFDAAGRPIRYLVRNDLCGTEGYYRWDGLDEKNGKLPIGIYILFTEVFNLEGKVKRFKQPIVLARRL